MHGCRNLVKVNLGSGSRGIEGWINIDIGLKYYAYKFLPLLSFLSKINLISIDTVNWIKDTGRPPPNWKKRDIRKKLPFKDNSVDFVYMSEVIEHFYFWEAVNILKEIHRILKPSGVLRITTPDIKKICQAYLSNEIDSFEFNSFFYPSYHYKKPKIIEKIGAKIYNTRYHLWLYDFATLKHILESLNFINIVELEPLKGKTPDLDKLENYDYSSDKMRLRSMYIEAEKPI